MNLILEHLPALQVVVPLIAAPLCMLLRKPDLCWGWALIVSYVCLMMSLALLGATLDGAVISYKLGGWAEPWGIEYRVDVVNAFVLVIVAGIGSVVATYGKESIESEVAGDRLYLFHCMYLLCLCGLLGIAITGDVFNLFVFLEVSSLSSYVLISLSRNRRALTASYNYLIMGTIGATFYIIGVGMMYMMTGSLNMADLRTLLPSVADTRTILVALAFLTVGISLKLALFPMHLWLPDAYTHAPNVVTAFMAATATKVSVYILLRIFFTVFGEAQVFEFYPLGDVLMILALAAMFIASAVAIFQKNIKRMLAYSSVAQIGYIVLGISFASVAGLSGGIVHLFNHAIMKCALFMACGCIMLRTGSVLIGDFAGLGRTMPITMASFVVAGLSMIGVPLTVGFISKWYLVQAALEVDLWPVALAILASSLLAVIYIWRVVEVAYFRPSPETHAQVREAPFIMLACMWFLTLASVYFGINAADTGFIAEQGARMLLGVLQ